jgi:glucose/arabinose dehydrogenase
MGEENSMFLQYLFHASQAVVALFGLSYAAATQTDILNSQYKAGIGPSEKIQLPPPFATPSVSNNSKVIGWPKGRMPVAAPGFEVSLFAEAFDNPRLAYVLPNEDILVVEVGNRSQKSVNRITLFS